jgi:cell division septum initiation protein DivIVA
MDVQDKLAQIIQLVEDARAMPMSASCLVNREETLGLLDELRAMLPEQLEQADVLLSDRDAVVEEGREAAKRLLDQARAEHDRLVEEQAVVVGARERAAPVITKANTESTRLLADADDYVDRKLAEFEIALDRLTQQVQRGRARLSERRAADLGRLPSDASYRDVGVDEGVDEPEEAKATERTDAQGPTDQDPTGDQADEAGDRPTQPGSNPHGSGLGDPAPLG